MLYTILTNKVCSRDADTSKNYVYKHQGGEMKEKQFSQFVNTAKQNKISTLSLVTPYFGNLRGRILLVIHLVHKWNIAEWNIRFQ